MKELEHLCAEVMIKSEFEAAITFALQSVASLVQLHQSIRKCPLMAHKR